MPARSEPTDGNLERISTGAGEPPPAVAWLPAPARRPSVEDPPTARGLSARLQRHLEGDAWIKLRFGCDLLTLALASAAAAALGPSPSAALLVLYPPLTLALLAARGRYRRRLRDVMLDSVASGFGAISIGAMTVFMLALLGGADHAELTLLVAHLWIGSVILVTATGSSLALAHHLARKRGLLSSPTLIVGCDSVGVEVARKLERHPEYGLRAVGFLDEGPRAPSRDGPPVLGRLGDLVEAVERWGIRHVIIGFPEVSRRDLLDLNERCLALGIETTVVPRLIATITRETELEYLGTVPLLNLRRPDLTGWQFAAKHAFDRVVAAVALAAVAPLMLAIALAVRLSSPGPILFSQLRAGRDGKAFELRKFRTMVGAEEEGFSPGAGLAPGGVEGADRRTRVGCLLRRTSLDELPQLINVLRGEMSLVGPRPERPEYVEMFRRTVDRYHERHRVRAGITGWAQVHGLRGQTPVDDRVELDNFYIEHWSLALDVKILLLTIPALLKNPDSDAAVPPPPDESALGRGPASAG